MRVLITVVSLVVALTLTYLFATPWLAARDMKAAADARDADALAAMIDFASVRASFKQQLNTRVEVETGARVGPTIGMLAAALTSTVSDRFIDVLVTPDGIGALLEGEVPDRSGHTGHAGHGAGGDAASAEGGSVQDPAGESGKRLSLRYTDWDRFQCDVANEKGEVTTFILRRQGLLSWRLVEVRLPSLAG